MQTNRTAQSFDKITTVTKQDDNKGYCTVYKMNCPDGNGLMTVYQVFPGIELVYDKFETTSCFCDMQTCSNDVMEINHCLEGRSECELQNGSYIYMGEGDLSVNVLSNHAMKMGFPLKHYRGIDIIIYFDELSRSLKTVFPDAGIDIYKLREKLCPYNECFIMRAKDTIKHIFSELYSVPDSIQKPYFKLKVLELLLFLNVIDVSKSKKHREYYTKQQVAIIKQIKQQITEEPNRRYTIEELSKKHDISRTALKACFKAVYGTSIAAYMKVFRMQYAAVMLQQTTESVYDIAVNVGYKNQSRFAGAFKEIMGISPLKYRKNNCPI